MAVQFILGDRPNQKRKIVIKELQSLLRRDPTSQMLYLIPDNVKYEAETMILDCFKEQESSNKSGMIRLQVFSFSRLAWYFLQNKAIYQRPQLTESGLAMLVKKILQEEEKNLTIFRGASQENGFVERLVSLFSEFRNGKITTEDLNNHLIVSESESEDGPKNKDIKQKIKDLSILYSRYDEHLRGKYVEKEDLYSELIHYIKEQESVFKNVTVIVDHYEHFSAQELELIITLSKYAKNVLINLTLNEEMLLTDNDLNNIFYRTTKTYYHLQDEFQQNKIEVLQDLYIGQSDQIEQTNNLISEDINVLSKYWLKSSQSTSSSELIKFKKKQYNNIELWAAEDSRTEIMHIATKIRQMVSTGNYRFKDFQIMSRDLPTCDLSIQAVFKENNIPFFIDQAETMAQHPILEFIVSLFSIKKRHYRIDDIFRFFKTELFIPKFDIDIQTLSEQHDGLKDNLANTQEETQIWRNKLDIAENVALAYGLQGSDWTQEVDWVYARFELEEEFEQNDYEQEIQEEANFVRKVFLKYIVPFLNQLDDMNTNREAVTLLYEFMSNIGVTDQLQYWSEQLNESGFLEEAREHEQAWSTFTMLLDEYVEVLGNEEWDFDLFLSVIETGFEQATYSMVPPTIDQVLVTNYNLPKLQSKKVVFVIGLTDNRLPMVQSNQSLLTDEDRELVEASLSSEKYLAASELETSANEPFMFYLNILQAQEKIIFTYPLADDGSGENRISPYLSRIQKALSLDIQFKYSNVSSNLEAKNEDHLQFIGTEKFTFGQTIISLRDAMERAKAPTPFWLEIFKKLYNPNNLAQKRILRSLSHKNIPTPLPEELAEKLYGKDLYLSVSQLETFFADPYSHFLLYGLRLRERQIQELSPLETGNFYHDALDLVSKQILSQKKDISELTREEIGHITNDVSKLLIDSKKYRLSKSSSRMGFIFKQLVITIENMAWSMVNQAKRSKFRTDKTELVFGQLGQNQDIHGLSFPLENNHQLHLRGKIDRIDVFEEDEQLYAGIVDYKSSNTTFNYQSIYYGLMLQMVTYLDTVLSYSEDIFDKKASPIGAFYSTVKNPFIDLKKIGNNDLDSELLKAYKLDGLIINNQEVLEAADTLLEPKDRSLIYNLYLKKDGAYSSKKILTEEEFEWLFEFNREKIIEAGNEILRGKNTLRPFNKHNIKVYTPSVDGPFRAISQFDALLPENNYQEVKKIDKDQFFDFLKDRYNDQKGAEK